MTTATKTARFQDTMVSATDYATMVRFYTEFVGLEPTQVTDDFTMLTDPETGQSLCITDGASVARVSPGIAVDSIEPALERLVELGGSVTERWAFGPMVGANATDPEGNELMVWELRTA